MSAHTSYHLNIRIDWSELDIYEHVNNVSYFKYIQAARIHFWETIGLYKQYAESGFGFVVASTSCDFKKPLQYPGSIDIYTQVTEIGNASFVLKHILYDHEKQLAAEGKDVLVVYDYTNNAKLSIDENLRGKLLR